MNDHHLIRDIRYYESSEPNEDFRSLPSQVGTIYPFPKSIHAISQRIARKLREEAFVTGSFDHVYLNFTTVLAPGEMHLSPRKPERLLRYIDYGLDPAAVASMRNEEREQLVTACTFRALGLLANDADSRALLVRVQRVIETSGSTLELHCRDKETTAYRVAITYQINPFPEPSIAFIEYSDKRTQRHGKRPFLRLQFYDDVFPLVGSITVSDGEVVIKPRESLKADVSVKRYQVPVRIPIKDVLADE